MHGPQRTHPQDSDFRALAEAMGDGVVLLDAHGVVTYVNAAAERLLHSSSDKLLGEPFIQLVPQRLQAVFEKRLGDLLAAPGTSSFEAVGLLRGGEEFAVEIALASWRSPSGLAAGVLMRDVTRRARREEAPQRGDLFRIVSDLASDYAYVIRIEPDGTTVGELLRGAFERITGYHPGELDARVGGFNLVHPDDRSLALRRVANLLSNQPDVSEYRIVTKSGGVRWVRDRGRPIWDESAGRVVRIYGAVQDITEAKQAEEEIRCLNASLDRRVRDRTEELARSNAELQQFAYVASHDLQEPLRVVASYTQLLAKRYRSQIDELADSYIERILGATGRMRTLIRDLLSYSRVGKQAMHLQRTSCESVLLRVLDLLHVTIGESRAQVTHDVLPTLVADESQLTHVFQNLLANAIKFHRVGATPQVHVGVCVENGGWRFSVRDNGIGIEQEYAVRVFNIFERLHARGEYPGTGIGLAICKKCVESHGGRIWFEAAPEGGTIFHFTIPAIEEGGDATR